MLTKASRKKADSAAMIRSQASASAQPIPAAGPLTAATHRLRHLADREDDRVVELAQALAEVGRLALVAGALLAQVGAGRERAPGAGDQHRADRVVGRRPRRALAAARGRAARSRR